MGNRAVITQHVGDQAPAIYLHWNGGRDSVEAFLKVARMCGIQGTGAAVMDSIANLVARHFFDCQVGINVYREPYGTTDQDNGDNGVYVIDEELRIVDRKYAPRFEDANELEQAEIVQGMCERIIAYFMGGQLGIDPSLGALSSAHEIVKEAWKHEDRGTLARIVRRAYIA